MTNMNVYVIMNSTITESADDEIAKLHISRRRTWKKTKKIIFTVVAMLILFLASVSAFAGSNSGTISFPPYSGSYTTSVSGDTITDIAEK